MFSGIVQDVGHVQRIEPRGGDLRIRIGFERLAAGDLKLGDSICVQGCCLTIVELAGQSFSADVSRETLRLTTLGELQLSDAVNLEPALRAGDPLGGHLVSGHVDAVAIIAGISEDARSQRVQIAVPDPLSRYIARKGSIALDGVSLTVNEVAGSTFAVNLIPHTRQVTTLGRLAPGTRVNLEIDQVARYLERLIQA